MEEQKFKKIFENKSSYENEGFLEDQLSHPIDQRTADSEIILCAIKMANQYQLFDIITNPLNHITDDEFNYIKRYFLKYYTQYAIKLYCIYQERFDESEKDYLLACCLENPHLAIYRLQILIESDFIGENPIMHKLVDSVMECNFYFDILKKILNIKNNDLQDYVLNLLLKDELIMDLLKDRFYELPVTSLVYKHIFYKNITNQKFVNWLINKSFLNLDDPEKQVFHDLYYQLIYKEYVKGSKIKLKDYFKSYKKYLFNDEMTSCIKKIYNGNSPFSKSDINEMFLVTDEVYNFCQGLEVLKQLHD